MTNYKSHHPYIKAVRKIERLKEDNRQISNKDAFDILCSHFISGTPIERLCEIFLKQGQDDTQIQKLLSKHEGRESSRRADVRRIFREFMIESGFGDPFIDYKSEEEQERKAKKKPTAKGFGLNDSKTGRNKRDSRETC